MSDYPWCPFYFDKWGDDTRDLTAEEKGVYFELIRLAWRRGDGGVPDDKERLKALLRFEIKNFHGLTYNRVVPRLLAKYFTLKDGVHYQKRVVQELFLARERSEKSRRNAEERWKKAKKNNEPNDAVAMPPHMLLTKKERKISSLTASETEPREEEKKQVAEKEREEVVQAEPGPTSLLDWKRTARMMCEPRRQGFASRRRRGEC